jgi:hypothetical protein
LLLGLVPLRLLVLALAFFLKLLLLEGLFTLLLGLDSFLLLG